MPVRTNSLYALLILFVLASCARQGAPAGGPKDTRPPEVDTLHSSLNYATRFDSRKIELKFDEWVVLSDVVTQVVVSPPLAKRPEVVLKGRTVVLSFDKNEVLRPNTTYTINFGASVKDLHEGNPAKDLRFVFSTGAFIDSLGFKGQVTDAFTGEPVENIAVLLHENQADTAIRKERPYYFTRTDKTGQYSFQNLRAGVFQLVAIEDADQNLKWDGENEKIAFLEQPISVSDSLSAPQNLKLFKNQSKFRLTTQQTNNYGLAKLVFNGAADSVQLQWQAPSDASILQERAPDSLSLWYDLSVDTAWNILVTHPEWVKLDTFSGRLTPFTDTIFVKKRSRSEFMEKHRLGFGDVVLKPASAPARGKTLGAPAPKPAPPPVKTIQQFHDRPASLPFNYPIQSFDTTLWQLNLDTVPVKNYTVRKDTLSATTLQLFTDWKQGKSYTLTLLPGALTDFWGKQLTDSLQRNFNIAEEKQLGTLNIRLDKLRPGVPYMLELLNNNILERTQSFIPAAETYSITMEHLPVASFTARLLEDLNGNGRWDTGDYNLKKQPEQIFIKKLDPLRANWSLEVSFSAETVLEKKRKQ
jgi:hypothetical protein